MSRYSDQLATSAIPVLFMEHGDSLHVLDPQNERDITAVVTEEMVEEAQQEAGRKQTRKRQATICTEDLGYGWVAKPAIGMLVRFAGVDYRVCEVPLCDPPLAIVTLARTENLDRTKANFRKP